MESLDTFVPQVQGLSSTKHELERLCHILNKSEDFLCKQTARLTTVLAALDPAIHSLGYLYALDALLSSANAANQIDILGTVSSFITCCSTDQIRLAPERFNSVCRKFKDHAVSCKDYRSAILPLETAARKVQPTNEYLTAQHADLAQVCLLAKCYNAALPLLDDDIFEVDPKTTGVTFKDFLLYCYYGGMVYTGLKNFQRAMEFYQHTITAPTSLLSAITVAAYKKLILVSLIAVGQVPNFPKGFSSLLQRNLKAACQPYLEVSAVYQKGDSEELRRSVQAQQDLFQTDSNFGLAKQLVGALHKKNIQRLTQTYVTLSLEDIAVAVKLGGAREAEMHVLRMIEDGDIFARINQKDGMVRFLEDPEQYMSREMADQLDRNIQRTIVLAKKLASVDEQVSSNRAFLNKVSTRERGGGRYGDYPEEFDLGAQKVFEEM